VRVGPDLGALVPPIAVASVGCLAGTLWGERLFRRIPQATYRRVVGAAVGAVGLWLLVRAV
jgi:uncharacterized membrane protein YfcA